MKIITDRIIIRAFEHKDAESLYRIVHQPDIVRFMKDWSEGKNSPQDYLGFIDWQQVHNNSTDIRENKRYAVALRESNEIIGMVGMGLEETVNEVELAYFMDENHRRRGYVKEAVCALADWCFSVSDIPYLILTIDCANTPSCRLAEKCGFVLFEKRTPIGHIQPNMESDSYFYYRKYRSQQRL